MSDGKNESLTIRLPSELKTLAEKAAATEKRSVASTVELALLERLIAYGYVSEVVSEGHRYNVRGRWLDIHQNPHPFPGQKFPSLLVTSPDEPNFAFGASTLESALKMAEAAFDGIDYGRKNPAPIKA